MKNLIYLFLFAVIISCNKEQSLNRQINDLPTKQFYMNGDDTVTITIKNHRDWAIIIGSATCPSGKGWCLKVNRSPGPSEYAGIFANHAIYSDKVMWIVEDDLIEDSEDYIEEGQLVIDDDIFVSEEIAEYVGKEESFYILEGSYDIDDDESGFQAITLDTDL